jgi:predicted nucleotidyltransferase
MTQIKLKCKVTQEELFDKIGNRNSELKNKRYMKDKILNIEKNILATIIYYDVLDFPLTSFEIWKHLIRTDYSTVPKNNSHNVSLQQVVAVLHERNLAGYIEQENGLYFLKNRKNLVAERISKQKLSNFKIKKLLEITRWLQYVPFVRMIGITGKLAMGQAHQKSDLDVLVSLKKGRIWTGRTLFTVLAHLFGKRRYGKHVSDRICLNYFIGDESLEILTKDLFSANEYMFMLPLCGWDLFKSFQLRNIWISSIKPSYYLSSIASPLLLKNFSLGYTLKQLGEYIFEFDLIENILRNIEKKRIEKNPKTSQDGSLVYAGDDALIFLPDPHGPKVFEKFKSNVSKLVA